MERVRLLLESYMNMLRERMIQPGAGSDVLSESGSIYHGVPFAVARVIRGEENAIGAMVTGEGINSKMKLILTVGSPEERIMPCGMCRVAIHHHSVEDTTVLRADQSLTESRSTRSANSIPISTHGKP